MCPYNMLCKSSNAAFTMLLYCVTLHIMNIHKIMKGSEILQTLFPKEEEIMYAIWEIGHPCGLSEILYTYPDLKRNTVTKVLVILMNKGYLKVDSIAKTKTRTGRTYAPCITKQDYDRQKRAVNDIVESPNAETGIMKYLSALVDSRDAGQELIEQMENMIEQYKRNNGI